jgi:hypothetical protein
MHDGYQKRRLPVKRISIYLVFLVFAFTMLIVGCTGVQPLKKGETMRCPSCGAVFPAEQGRVPDK